MPNCGLDKLEHIKMYCLEKKYIYILYKERSTFVSIKHKIAARGSLYVVFISTNWSFCVKESRQNERSFALCSLNVNKV